MANIETEHVTGDKHTIRVRPFIDSRYTGVSLFCLAALISFAFIHKALEVADLSNLDIAFDDARQFQNSDGELRDYPMSTITTNLVDSLMQSDIVSSGIAKTVSRLSSQPTDWPMPPASKIVPDDLPGFDPNLEPNQSNRGWAIINFQQVPKLAYKNGGTARIILRANVSTPGEFNSEENNNRDFDDKERIQRVYKTYSDIGSDGSVSIKEVDYTSSTIEFSLYINSDRGLFSTDPQLTDFVVMGPEVFRGAKPVQFEMNVLPKIEPEIVQTGNLPKTIQATMGFERYNPDCCTGGDNTAKSPEVLIPRDSQPFQEIKGSVSYIKGDATDFVSVGGNNRFTLVFVTADSDLRRALVAKRTDNGQVIGRYNNDGSAFAAVADAWSAVVLKFVASERSQAVKYRVFATASDTYAAMPFFLWFASLDNRLAVNDQVPETPAQSLELLDFFSNSMGLDFSKVELGEQTTPNAAALIKLLRSRHSAMTANEVLPPSSVGPDNRK